MDSITESPQNGRYSRKHWETIWKARIKMNKQTPIDQKTNSITMRTYREKDGYALTIRHISTLLIFEKCHIDKDNGSVLIAKATKLLKTQKNVAAKLSLSKSQVSKIKGNYEDTLIIEEEKLPFFECLMDSESYEIVVDGPLGKTQEEVDRLDEIAINSQKRAEEKSNSELNRFKRKSMILHLSAALAILTILLIVGHDNYRYSFEYNGIKNPFGFFDVEQKARYEELKKVCTSLPSEKCQLNNDYYNWHGVKLNEGADIVY